MVECPILYSMLLGNFPCIHFFTIKIGILQLKKIVQAKLEVEVNVTMAFPLHEEDDKVISKVWFKDLAEMTKQER